MVNRHNPNTLTINDVSQNNIGCYVCQGYYGTGQYTFKSRACVNNEGNRNNLYDVTIHVICLSTISCNPISTLTTYMIKITILLKKLPQ